MLTLFSRADTLSTGVHSIHRWTLYPQVNTLSTGGYSIHSIYRWTLYLQGDTLSTGGHSIHRATVSAPFLNYLQALCDISNTDIHVYRRILYDLTFNINFYQTSSRICSLRESLVSVVTFSWMSLVKVY